MEKISYCLQPETISPHTKAKLIMVGTAKQEKR